MYGNHVFSAGGWLPLVVFAVALIFVFEIWMIVDAATNKKISDKAKAFWIVGMLLVHPLVAIAYFFTDRRKQR